MDTRRASDGQEFKGFDLVELVRRHNSHERGAQGTVVLIGGSAAVVDFSWVTGNGPRRPDGPYPSLTGASSWSHAAGRSPSRDQEVTASTPDTSAIGRICCSGRLGRGALGAGLIALLTQVLGLLLWMKKRRS